MVLVHGSAGERTVAWDMVMPELEGHFTVSVQCGASKRHSNISAIQASATSLSSNRRTTSSTAITFAERRDRPSYFIMTNFSTPAVEVSLIEIG